MTSTPTQLPLEGIHGLLILITEALHADLDCYEHRVNDLRGELQVTWQGEDYWMLLHKGQAPFRSSATENANLVASLRLLADALDCETVPLETNP